MFYELSVLGTDLHRLSQSDRKVNVQLVYPPCCFTFRETVLTLFRGGMVSVAAVARTSEVCASLMLLANV